MSELIAKLLAEHADYVPDDDSSGDVCAGCFAKLDPDGDSHAGSLAGLRKHQAAVVLAHLIAKFEKLWEEAVKTFNEGYPLAAYDMDGADYALGVLRGKL